MIPIASPTPQSVAMLFETTGEPTATNVRIGSIALDFDGGYLWQYRGPTAGWQPAAYGDLGRFDNGAVGTSQVVVKYDDTGAAGFYSGGPNNENIYLDAELIAGVHTARSTSVASITKEIDAITIYGATSQTSGAAVTGNALKATFDLVNGHFTPGGGYFDSLQIVAVGSGARTAANLTTGVTTYAVNGASTATLAAGAAGQTKKIVLVTQSVGPLVVTVTNAAWGGATTATFAAVNASLTLQYLNSTWMPMSNIGVVLA